MTVVTGFLGAGKTTLVNRVLASAGGKRLAVIVNEFGDIGLDGELIESETEDLVELSSGCICCVVRGDLIRTIRGLIQDRPELDGIVIETTGLANPSPVIQTMSVDQLIAARCRLDAVVCVVDALHVTDQLGHSVDAADQIALADLLVVTKSTGDTTGTGPAGDIEGRLRALNPLAPVLCANGAGLSASDILDQHRHDPDRVAASLAPAPHGDADHRHDHDHSGHIDKTGITSVTLTADVPLDGPAFEIWLRDLLDRYGSDILRTKGILDVAGEDRKLILQAVNMLVEAEFRDRWDTGARQSRIVFIGRRLPRDILKTGFAGCQAEPVAQEVPCP